MRLTHTKPCRQCPWRRVSAPGWLGGNTAETYADIVQGNEIPACHMEDHGQKSSRTAFCAGALACSANAAILPRGKAEIDARNAVGRNPDVFTRPAEFYAHHTGGQEYRTPLMRKIHG